MKPKKYIFTETLKAKQRDNMLLWHMSVRESLPINVSHPPTILVLIYRNQIYFRMCKHVLHRIQTFWKKWK